MAGRRHKPVRKAYSNRNKAIFDGIAFIGMRKEAWVRGNRYYMDHYHGSNSKRKGKHLNRKALRRNADRGRWDYLIIEA